MTQLSGRMGEANLLGRSAKAGLLSLPRSSALEWGRLSGGASAITGAELPVLSRLGLAASVL